MERLTELVIELQGERVTLRGDRTAFWHRESLLIAADLHVGKTESLRRRGVTLPHGVLDDDLTRLESALAQTRARRLLVLGDLVHDASALTVGVRDSFAMWRARVDVPMELVVGNHDESIAEWPAEWRLALRGAQLDIPPFGFVHDAALESQPAHASGLFRWSGHVHPVVTLRGGVDRQRLPCFVVGPDVALLPAFSRLTGGFDVRPTPDTRVIAVVEGLVLPIPAAH